MMMHLNTNAAKEKHLDRILVCNLLECLVCQYLNCSTNKSVLLVNHLFLDGKL